MSSTSVSRVAPKTPIRNTPTVPPPVDSPGNWTHPRLKEITRRRNASTFSERNVRKIVYNIGALVVLHVLQHLADSYLRADLFTPQTKQILSWIVVAIKALPLINTTHALLPLFRNPDEMTDIPLTPSQRKLLGLAPSSAPPTPNATYSTPPRYTRTPSISGSVGSRASYSSTPLSASRGSLNGVTGGGSGAARTNGSPYSASPLHGKGFNPTLSGGRRSSFGSPSPLAASGAMFPDPASPSPSGAKKTSVGLNNKWLYEKGRRSSGSWMQ